MKNGMSREKRGTGGSGISKRVSLTAESAGALAVVGVSIQGTVRTATVTRVLLTASTVVVTQARLCRTTHTHITLVVHVERSVPCMSACPDDNCRTKCPLTGVRFHQASVNLRSTELRSSLTGGQIDFPFHRRKMNSS